MPEREGVPTLTPTQRRKKFAKIRADLQDRLVDDDAETYVPMNRAHRRAMQREIVKGLRHRGTFG